MKLKYRFLKISICLTFLVIMWAFSVQRYDNRKFDHPNLNAYNKQDVSFVNDSNLLQCIYKTVPDKNSIQIGDLNVAEIETELHKNLFIDTANVYLNQKGDLYVYIQQKEPIVRIKSKENEFYLDKKAVAFPLSSQYAKNCLLVNGEIDTLEYPKIVRLAHVISMDKLLTKHIIGVNKVSKNSFNLLLNTNAFELEFGDLENIEAKFNNLKEFYNQYLNHVGLEMYKKISLKYKNQIVATKYK